MLIKIGKNVSPVSFISFNTNILFVLFLTFPAFSVHTHNLARIYNRVSIFIFFLTKIDAHVKDFFGLALMIEIFTFFLEPNNFSCARGPKDIYYSYSHLMLKVAIFHLNTGIKQYL